MALRDKRTDHRALRDAFGCFATGITVVTTVDQSGRAIGKTANSFASVSLEPPLVLWCLNKNSVTFNAFHASPHFVISVMGAGGTEATNRFSMRGGHMVDDSVPVVATELGPPTFAGALAVFECECLARHDAGDHVILVGRVVRFRHAADPERKGPQPLLYYRGRYGGLTEHKD